MQTERRSNAFIRRSQEDSPNRAGDTRLGGTRRWTAVSTIHCASVSLNNVDTKATDPSGPISDAISGKCGVADTYLEEGTDVCMGIIYPKSPRDAEVRKQVEETLNEEGIQVVWRLSASE